MCVRLSFGLCFGMELVGAGARQAPGEQCPPPMSLCWGLGVGPPAQGAALCPSWPGHFGVSALAG